MRVIVTKITDGDTFHFSFIHKILDFEFNVQAVVRLARINAPEKTGATKEEGLAAKDYLSTLILGQKVKIKPIKKDDFGRWISEVIFNGQNVNDLLVSNGFAVYQSYR